MESENIKNANKAVAVSLAITAVCAINLWVGALWAVSLWGKTHTVVTVKNWIQFPVKILETQEEQAGLLVASAETPTPPTPKQKDEIANNYGMGWLINNIRELESAKGTAKEGHHKFCESIGRSNEFGYFPNGNKHFCFNTFEESVQIVTNYWKEQLRDMPLDVALCYYNTGNMEATCKYSQDFHKL